MQSRILCQGVNDVSKDVTYLSVDASCRSNVNGEKECYLFLLFYFNDLCFGASTLLAFVCLLTFRCFLYTVPTMHLLLDLRPTWYVKKA